jgi:hypothetical protein
MNSVPDIAAVYENAVEGASPGGRGLHAERPPAEAGLAVLKPEKARVGQVLDEQALGEKTQTCFCLTSKYRSILDCE